ncbi:MAG: PD-(D/E)XK motif protein [Burkholderiales bacterium]|nr:PD-(D/E)XK motif protein [Burkholderiales bacterium]
MSIEDLFRRAELAGEDPAHLRIDESHPVDIAVGLDGGRRAIVVVCAARPPEPPTMGAMRVTVGDRKDHRWAVLIRLERPDMAPLFTRLAEDLAEATRKAPDRPGDVVIDRLNRWQRLFARGPSGLLDDLVLRGLAAELLFLREEAVSHLGPQAAVQAWQGPYEAPKDFVFCDREVEVKATSRQPRALHISSYEQLEDAGLPLFLWARVVELEHGAPDLARSVANTVRQARAAVAGHAEAAEALESALLAAGWEDREEYEARLLRVGPSTCYGVTEGFPRIRRSQLAVGILDGAYRLDTAVLTGFVADTWKGAQGGSDD